MRINKKSRSAIKLIFFSFVVLAILIGSMSPYPIPMFFQYSDKVYHFTAFFVLTLMVLFLLGNRVIVACCSLVLFSGAIELYQGLLLPMRTYSSLDFMANSAGVFFGAILYYIITLTRSKFERCI